MPPDITVRRYTPADAQAIFDLQVRYAAAFPGAQVVPPEVYAGPGFAHGARIACAVSSSGDLLGYAALYRAAEAAPGVTVSLFGVFKPDPALMELLPLRQALFGWLLALTEETRAVAGTRESLCFEHLPAEGPAVEFALDHGFSHTASAFHMSSDLRLPLDEAPLPPGVSVRAWKMESEAEQRQYLEARDPCFPDSAWSLASLQYLLGSPLWRDGAAITAFSGDDVVGSVLAYWDPGENARTGCLGGYTEEVFVLPQWRGRGIARHLLTEALRHLRRHGLAEARLVVSASNRDALGLYQSLGYSVMREVWHLCREV